MSKYAIVEVPENWVNKDFLWSKVLDTPVALMQKACELAGVGWGVPKKGDYYFKPGCGFVHTQTDFSFNERRLVIPAPKPEPCPNCQGIRPGYTPPFFWNTHESKMLCRDCGRPESEWTYARDINDDPEYAPGGIL